MCAARCFLRALTVAGFCAWLLAPSARADILITSSVGGGLRDGWTNNADYSGTVGTAFTVGPNPLLVTALGYYDGPNSASSSPGDGLLDSHGVAIWNATGTMMLASAVVPAGVGGTLVGDFRYVPVSVVLAANTRYVLGGQVPLVDSTPAGDVFRDLDSESTTSSASSYNSRWSTDTSGSLVFPNVENGPSTGYLGPNLQFQVVPEPGTLTLSGIALALTAGYGWRRRRIAVA
jgi:hypothetical protein